MGKSKKKKRNDARGYGGGKGSQTPATQSAASSSDMVVTKQTHEGIQSLVDRLRSTDINSKYPKERISSPDISTADSTIRFVPKLTKIVDRLVSDLGFKYDPDVVADDLQKSNCHGRYLEEMVRVLGYGITLESALDWLCLNVPTLLLPPLFTDGNLRNNLMQEERQGGGNNDGDNPGGSSSSLTVLKFISSSPATQSTTSTEDKAAKEEETKQKEIEKQKQLERLQKIQKEKQMAKEKADAEEREIAKKKLLEQYAEYHSDSDHDEGSDANNSPDMAAQSPLSPQEIDLLAKEKELGELEADLGCEANNYMRSKQEMKLLRNQVKKLKQQVGGLRRKVENQKRQREQEQRREEEQANQNEEDDEEETGAGFFDGGGLFDNAEEEEEEEAEITPATDTPPKALLDCPIPKGWTGTTPRKTLDDICRKQRLGKPKYLNLGGGSLGGYKLSGIRGRKSKSDVEDVPIKDEWIALSSNFTTESSLPDYLALQALYAIDSNKPLYGMFPPAFRSLWLSWLQEVQQQNDDLKQSLEIQKNRRIQHLLRIIEANHRTDTVSVGALENDNDDNSRRVSDTSKGVLDEDNNLDTSLVMESWEDIDDREEGNNLKTRTSDASKAGTSLKREFLERQKSKSYAEMLRQRENLPMTSYRSEILDIIKKHQVMILCAETVSL